MARSIRCGGTPLANSADFSASNRVALSSSMMTALERLASSARALARSMAARDSADSSGPPVALSSTRASASSCSSSASSAASAAESVTVVTGGANWPSSVT